MENQKKLSFWEKLLTLIAIVSTIGVIAGIYKASKPIENLKDNTKVTTKEKIIKNDEILNQLFYIKYKTNSSKGTTRIQGYHSKTFDDKKLKEHCRKQYGGFTTCFYYKKKLSNLVYLSSMSPYKGLLAASKTSYFKRVDISVDGKSINISKKQ
jgi:hypothetical protein